MALPPQAWRKLVLGGIAAAAAASAALHISFVAPFFNFLAVLIALCGAGALVLALFGIGPRWFGIPLGLLGLGGWLMACLWVIVTAAFDANAPVDVALGDELLCRRTTYGFVASDSGHELAIYRRMLFVERRLYYERVSDIYPSEPPSVPTELRGTVNRCRM
ncbi:MAG: hypothetical protein WCC39_03200 [Telluria sp.]